MKNRYTSRKLLGMKWHMETAVMPVEIDVLFPKDGLVLDDYLRHIPRTVRGKL